MLGGLGVKITSVPERKCQESLCSGASVRPSFMGENVIASLVDFSFILVCGTYNSSNLGSTSTGQELLLEIT